MRLVARWQMLSQFYLYSNLSYRPFTSPSTTQNASPNQPVLYLASTLLAALPGTLVGEPCPELELELGVPMALSGEPAPATITQY